MYRRLAAITVTQVLLSKHISHIAALDVSIAQQLQERASLQIKCQTEHERLRAVFIKRSEFSGKHFCSKGTEVFLDEQETSSEKGAEWRGRPLS